MKTKSTADKKIDNTAAELKSLIHDAEKILSESGEASSNKLTEVRDRLEHLLHDGQEKVEHIKEVAKEKLETADGYVRTHPYHAVGVAAGVGAIVGVLASRREA